MSYNKFINIHEFFHTANNDDISNLDDIIYKIRPILVHFTMLWRTYYEIKSHLAIHQIIQYYLHFGMIEVLLDLYQIST